MEALDDGRSVTAKTTHSDGSTEEVQVSSGGPQQQEPIHYDVALVPQPNKTSCWAAAMAMLEGYRRSMAASASMVLSAADLAAEVGYSLEQSYGWDRLEDVKDFYGFKDIQLVGSQYPTAAQWRQWLRERGPLYVTVVGEPSSHAIVIHGIAGDETATGARVEVLDPWDISQTFDSDPTVFNPPNEGTAITLSVDELNRKFNGGDLSKLAIFEDWRILYLPGLEANAGTTAPTGAAKRTFRIQRRQQILRSRPRHPIQSLNPQWKHEPHRQRQGKHLEGREPETSRRSPRPDHHARPLCHRTSGLAWLCRIGSRPAT